MRLARAIPILIPGVIFLVGCGSAESQPSEQEVETPAASASANGEFNLEAINAGTAEMTEIGEELGMVATLAAEACLQEDGSKLANLDGQVDELLARAEAVPDGGSMNMVIARTSAQTALRKASEGLSTCDPATWLEVTTAMVETGAALEVVAAELQP